MLANKSLSRSLLIIIALSHSLPLSISAKKDSEESENGWLAPATLGLVGGVIVGTALTAWCKNSEINDIDYRPLTSLQELESTIHNQYGHLLENINTSGTLFYDYRNLKRNIRNQSSCESFLESLTTFERDMRLARKQLKNQIHYWDSRTHDAYAESRHVLAKSKTTFKKLQSLRKLAQEMIPVLHLEELVQCIKYSSYLHYEDLCNTPKHFLESNIIDIAHKQVGKKLAHVYPLIALEETLQEYITALTKALKLHKKDASLHFDQALHQEGNKILNQLEIFHAALTHSVSYKIEVTRQQDAEHRKNIEREIQEQTRIARKQLEYEKEQLRYAREQRDTQLRTEQQIAMLRLENAIRDLY